MNYLALSLVTYALLSQVAVAKIDDNISELFKMDFKDLMNIEVTVAS